MATEHLSTYLNDHLAGAVAGVSILEAAIEHIADPQDAEKLDQVKREIDEDKVELERLISGLDIDESTFRKATGWISEKMAEIKLRFDDPGAGELFVFEALEALSLGIEGKRSLWKLLSAASGTNAKLQDVDYERLIKRAEGQRDRVEALRIKAGVKALI
jgi:hypothetical protein